MTRREAFDRTINLDLVERHLELLQYDCESEGPWLIDMWNRYTWEVNCPDDEIYCMDSFDEIMEGTKPMDLARMIRCGDYSPAHDWFRFGSDGNIYTADIYDAVHSIDIHGMAEWIVDNNDALGDRHVESILGVKA